MMSRRVVLFVVSILAAFTVITCSKAKNPASPGGGGGGGGGGSPPTFNMSFPATGTSQKFTFDTPGTWDYHCIPHAPGMAGTVVVSAAATLDSDTVAVGRNSSYVQALSFKPSTVTIKPGGYVRWVNRSSMTSHTVTRP
jgi:plastocyanin